MSSIAYENLAEDSKWVMINEQDYDDIFRSCPTEEEHNDGHTGWFRKFY